MSDEYWTSLVYLIWTWIHALSLTSGETGFYQIIERHESIFSRHKMDCGEASDFVHKIHLVDERPFRLPYHRVPPSHYEKLKTALNEMEERGIIRKSASEYASPLIFVWKKNGDLRIFRFQMAQC
ncbi:hypothetical protein L3Q82_003655 [Scortum barcoo]|uniref:Uncharacterized protein n=1 Tax=Scortum barcoo TaxID=214431 RepID=A0ACB8VNA3_9TELE|nr:hypothetical protein L3Q82_003655 [Scortum barcoo]